MSLLESEKLKLGTMTQTKITILQALREGEVLKQTEELVRSEKRLYTQLETLETIIKEQNQLIRELEEREVSHE